MTASMPEPARRPLRRELALVAVVSLAVLVPGLWRYSLLDPWETHYGEVARMMLQEHDLVHTQWPQDNEGFRSKPVLMFWMMAAGLTAVDVADDGGYSGELTRDGRTMLGLRLPFVLAAVCGLVLLWWMLARLVSRRLAWLALLVIGSTPMFCMIARQAIPDMPLTACTLGALALLALALEDGDRPIAPLGHLGRGRRGGRRIAIDARHVVLGLAGGFVVVQAAYYAYYFATTPQRAMRGGVLPPGIWLPALMVLLLAALWHRPWRILRRPLGRTRAAPIADRLLAMAPLTTMRQVYLIGMYFLLGVSLLAKGPPGVTVIGAVGALHVLLGQRWRALWEGGFELKRGVLLAFAVAVPWHIAMFFKEGPRFIDEYVFQHILNRAGDGSIDKSLGTFEHYTSQIGHGMWLWAALLPAAVAAAVLRARTDTREGRVRFLAALWAFAAVAVFCLVQTKFHHYILPAIPALGLLVAFLLDDLLAGRDRLHPLFAAIGVAIALLVTRDLMHEPERWVEMFVYLYDRPWPAAPPYAIDPSGGFFGLGLVAALAVAVLATRFVRAGVALAGAAGLAICVWALQIYMPLAGTHWGMRDAVRTYYEQRTIYGEKLVYFGAAQLAAQWQDVGETWTFPTFIPDALQVGQPMTITVRIHKPADERALERELVLRARATAIGDHEVTVTFEPGERRRLDPWIAEGARQPTLARRRPVRAVDADRLIAWQLYWRGENFWSGDEIWGWLPEMKTAFVHTNNQELLKYLGDRTRAPLGRRYFVISGAGQLPGLRGTLPTSRARDSFQILDTTSNKFSLGAFDL